MSDPWADGAFGGALQLIAEGLAAAAGFGVAFIQVADKDGVLYIAAVAGLEEARQQLGDYRGHVQVVADREGLAEKQGMFRFIREEELPTDEWLAWEPEIEVADHPNAWRPRDLLFAPLRDDQDRIVGVLWVDVPDSGLRPDAACFELLNKYAQSTQRALIVALANRALDEQVRLAEAASFVVRNVSTEASLQDLLLLAQQPLADGLRVRSTWILTYDEDGEGAQGMYGHDGSPVEALGDETIANLQPIMERLWNAQDVLVFQGSFATDTPLSPDQQSRVRSYIEEAQIHSMVLVPLGVGGELLGGLILARVQGVGEWSQIELDAVRDIGHDIGRALANVRSRAFQARLVHELRALDDYKSRLIATVAHELKNPLTGVAGHLEMLESATTVTEMEAGLAAIGRGTLRMRRVVDNLLVLAELGDDSLLKAREPVDLGAVVTSALEDLSITAELADIMVYAELPDHRVVVDGDAESLDRVVTNLTSNAVKYSHPGSRVVVQLKIEESARAEPGREVVEPGRAAVLTVADTGLGISEADQERLFEEFFRSTNPEASQRPGTGLGLAIVRRVVERHRGTIKVDSALGRGTRVEVRLPVGSR